MALASATMTTDDGGDSDSGIWRPPATATTGDNDTKDTMVCMEGVAGMKDKYGGEGGGDNDGLQRK